MSATGQRHVPEPVPPGPAPAARAPLTRFVGRGAEIERARRLLEETRLLTLTGPGGSGKTRLALEVARREEAVRWVELAPLADPATVAAHVAAALGVADEAGRSPEEGLAAALDERPGLLVLDNCEHLVEACAALAARLLRGCAGLRILATSREALGVEGETAWLVPPLSLPEADASTPESVGGCEAVQLFVERARAVAPAFALTPANAAAVAAICRRLDGVPLAIELAAARVNVLPPAQLLARLDDCFRVLVHRGRSALPRHRTIRAAIDWSYELLPPRERLLLQRLSVFSGGFTLEAAEAVCAGGGIEGWEVLELLAALVERSLVEMREQGDTARYRLLEVVRQYAAERLGTEGGAGVAARHAAYFAAFADDAAPHVELMQDLAWLERLTAEHDNLRAALEHGAGPGGEPAAALRIAAAFGPVAVYSMQWTEGRRWLEQALAVAGAPRATPVFVRALRAAGSLASALHDGEAAAAWLQEAERLARERGDPRETALVLAEAASAAMHAGDADRALALAEEGVALARGAGDPHARVAVLSTGLGFVRAFRGETAEADAACAEAQALAERHGYALGLLYTSFSRAMIAWMRGDFDAAERHSAAAAEAVRRLGNRWYVGRALFVPAAVALHRGEAARAARCLAACETRYRLTGGHLVEVERPLFDDLVERARGALGEEAFARAWAEGAAWSADRALAEAAGGAAAGPPPASSPPVEAPPEEDAGPGAELVVRALGPLEVRIEGRALPAESWAYAKPRELLLFLLFHRGGASKEEIGRALWPDASPQQLRNNLHVTLHYLRKALGDAGWIVFAEERYRIAPGRSVWFDAEALERGVEAALAAEGDEAALAEALALHRGELLEEERCGAWHLDFRDRVRAAWVRGLGAVAERAFARGAYGEARRLLEAIVAREALDEHAHRRLLQCLARTGAREEALTRYRALERLLRDEAGCAPEEETRALAEAIASTGEV